MIIFKDVKWKNFLSTGNEWVELNLNKNRHTLIVGSNGSGKSTILDAVSFGLFGKAHRKIPKPNLVNSINKSNCIVEIRFTIGSNEYKIIRGIAPTIFEIYINGKLEDQSSHAKEYQKILEMNILKLNHKSFHQIVVLGSTSFIPFMQLPLNQRRDIIDDLLNISIFTKMNLILKEYRSSLKTMIGDLKHEIELSNSNKKIHEEHIDKLRSSNEFQKKQKSDRIAKIEKDIKVILKENESITLDSKDELNKSHSKLSNDTDKIRLETNGIDSELKVLIKKTNFYKTNDTCPTCKTQMTKITKDENMNSIITKGKSLFTQKELLQSKLEDTEKELKNVNESLQKLSELENTVKSNNESIKSLTSRKLEIEQEIKDFENSDADIKDIENKLTKLNKSKEKTDEKLYEVSNEMKYNKVMGEMLKDDGIKINLIKQYIPVINRILNEYLEKLDFFAKFTFDNSFNEEIKSRHLDSFKYESFSEGEKTKIDLSLLFTWREIAKMNNSVSTNLLILDETFDSSLDFDGVENLIRLLYDENDNNNTFIISHKHELKDRFTTILEFFKRNNFSSYSQAT